MSTGAKITSNSISAVLRCYMIILLTLKVLYNTAFLRVDINIMILIIQKNVISYNKINLSWDCKNYNKRVSFCHVSSDTSSSHSLYDINLIILLRVCKDKSTHHILLIQNINLILS